jgi:hypothetical protein
VLDIFSVAEYIGQCGRKFLAEVGNAKDRKKKPVLPTLNTNFSAILLTKFGRLLRKM